MQKGDKKLSKKRANLKRGWEEIKGQELSWTSPYNMEDEEDNV